MSRTSQKNLSPFDKRYLLQKKIGEGGSSEVYLASDSQNLSAKIVLKISLNPLSDSFTSTILRKEFEQLTELQHPNLAQVFDCGVWKNKFYFSQEWIEGKNILEYCKSANLNTVFDLLIQTLRALHYIHAEGIVHQDLKPDNLLIQQSENSWRPRLKMIDFGLAQNLDLVFKPKDFSGTPPYAAPEIILGKKPDFRSDLYSFGVLSYQILTGKIPFEGNRPEEYLSQQLYQEASAPVFSDFGIPDSIGTLLLKLLSKNPDERPHTALEVLEELNRSLSENFSIYPERENILQLKSFPYVFRKEELLTLYEKIFDYKTLPLLLEGEKGSGKSFLLDKLKQRAQLNGLKVLSIHEKKSLEEILKISAPQDFICLIDCELNPKEEQDFILKLLQKRFLFVWASTQSNLKNRSIFKKHHKLKLLTASDFSSFLKIEIAYSISKKDVSTLCKETHGLPSKLESYLQTLFQKQWIIWSPQGWKKLEGKIPNPLNILKEHQKHLHTLQDKLNELLKLAAEGISLKLLTSLLNTPENQLRALLEENQIFSIKKEKDSEWVYLKNRKNKTLPSFPHQWKLLNHQLESLYHKGLYPEADEFIQGFVQSKNQKKIPPESSLLIARNYIALGKIKEAAQYLTQDSTFKGNSAALWEELWGKIYFGEGNFLKSIPHLLKALQKYQTLKNIEGISRIQNLEALILKNTGNIEASENKFKEAIASAKKLKSAYLQSVYYLNLATLYHDHGNYQQADQSYKQALGFSHKHSHARLSCVLFHNQTNLQYQLGKSREVEKLSLAWYELALKQHFPDQQAAALNYLSLIEMEKNNFTQTISFLNQAILLSENQDALLAQSLLNRAHAQLECGRYFASLLDAQDALDISEKTKNQANLSRAYLMKGKILKNQINPDFIEALKCLKKAQQLSEQSSQHNLLWEIELELADLFFKEKQYEKSRTQALEAQHSLEKRSEKIPEEFRKSFWRDRKDEKIFALLNRLAELKG